MIDSEAAEANTQSKGLEAKGIRGISGSRSSMACSRRVCGMSFKREYGVPDFRKQRKHVKPFASRLGRIVTNQITSTSHQGSVEGRGYFLFQQNQFFG
jgi:ribosomal protein S18